MSTTTPPTGKLSQKAAKHEPEPNINLKLLLENYIHKHDTTKYEFEYFLSLLKQKQSSHSFMVSVLVQLKPVIPLLEPKHFETNLINVLFVDIKWSLFHSNNQVVLNLLKEFLIDLNSAYTNYIQKCLQMLVKLFQIVPVAPETTAVVAAESSVPQINCESIYELAHAVINQLIKIVPTSKTILISHLDQFYPYMIKETPIQEAYITNLFKIAENFPDLRLKVLEICVQKLLKIDVNCRREQILEYEQMNAAAAATDETMTTDRKSVV